MIPLCPHFPACGGCQTQDVPYPAQLAQKRARLVQLLQASLGRAAPHVEPLVPMPVTADGMPWNFRHKASFVFGPVPGGRRGFVMGHYAAGSNRVIPVDVCPVHSSLANRLAFALRDRLLASGLRAAGPALDGVLRHVIVRTSHDDTQAVVMLVVTRNDPALRGPLRAFIDAERPTGLLVNVHDRPGPFMVGRHTRRITGRTHVRETRLGLPFLVSPAAFFQTNPDAAAAMLDHVQREIGRVGLDPRESTMIDLYAGSGLFALPLAAQGFRVIAVEENAQAVVDGEENQRLNRIPQARLRFVRARVEDALPRLAREHPDLVVLDPPRSGCPPRVLKGVFRELAPATVIYVSCNAEALVRELPAIVSNPAEAGSRGRNAGSHEWHAGSHGYRITRVQPVDMFPHTLHIETMVTLERDRVT